MFFISTFSETSVRTGHPSRTSAQKFARNVNGLGMLRQVDVQAPLLVIGAGRSGTTLAMRILQSHPEIDFRGETAFLVPRLWRECFDNRFWYNWERYVRLNPTSSSDILPTLEDNELRKLEQHVGASLAEFVVELLGVSLNAKTWGYKELWNGNRSFDFDWAVYDHVFPRATWVHLIRNPFSFSRSAARWSRHPLDLTHLLQRLHEWVAITRRCLERSVGAHYFEIKHEDIVLKPRETFEPILHSLGVDWRVELLNALESKILASAPSTYEVGGEHLPNLDYFNERVKGLAELMLVFGYQLVPLDLEISRGEITNAMVKL